MSFFGRRAALGKGPRSGLTAVMEAVFQTRLPDDMRQPRALPGVQPARGPWLCVDEAYAGQMARREALLSARRDEVLWSRPEAFEPARELLDHVLDMLPGLGFSDVDGCVQCPDGRRVALRRDEPLQTLGRLVQCDFCLLDRGVEGAHVLQGAVLCFPARWRLDEKAGRPLTAIHDPVAEYDDRIAVRVQRLFDGVRPDRPLWRFNRLWYDDPELFQPRSVHAPRRTGAEAGARAFLRSERQTILRLPRSSWVVFAIHTFVLRAADVSLVGPQGTPVHPATP